MAENRLQLFIDRRRRDLGITSQRELSRLMGRDESAVNKIITRGSTAPTAELVRDLAVALRVPLEEIYWALGLTEARPQDASKVEQQELFMIYDHLDEERRRQLVSYGEFLLTNGRKPKNASSTTKQERNSP